ncbi:MAG: SDR family NAD(P)-dependent oxidoreductase [bacterium]|nr:SDR family NAD(P)-dependent oxidoreductase [bacterium]
MKTVVITGSARGFGFEMAKLFKKNELNVVVCDVNEVELKKAVNDIEKIKSKSDVIGVVVDVTSKRSIKNLIDETLDKFKTIDIWINNAGVNQPNKTIWDLSEKEISTVFDIDLKGTVICSNMVMPIMIKQKSGAIYNVEGHGSNDATILGLSIYGTAKRAITYFTEALAYECEKEKTNVIVGKITPGIMITNFIHTSLGDGKEIIIDEKTKKIYNILGDYPETIAKFMVTKIIKNTENRAKFVWLSPLRAFYRFLSYPFKKRNFFR